MLADRGSRRPCEALGRARDRPSRSTDARPRRRCRSIETAAYFVVAEAITNAAKHAGGAAAHGRARATHRDRLVVEVGDDGLGGADPTAPG